MPLWLKSTSAESRPKWLGGDGAQGASGAKEDCHATTAGWAMRAGTAASGPTVCAARSRPAARSRSTSATVGRCTCRPRRRRRI